MRRSVAAALHLAARIAPARQLARSRRSFCHAGFSRGVPNARTRLNSPPSPVLPRPRRRQLQARQAQPTSQPPVAKAQRHRHGLPVSPARVRRRATLVSSASARATALLLPIGPAKRGARVHSQSSARSDRTAGLTAATGPLRLGAGEPAWWAASLLGRYGAQAILGR